MSRSKKSFKDMSPAQQRVIVATTAIALVVVAAAERDIQRRSDAEINGSRLLWRLLSLNALGALSYFRWGRRRASV